MPLSRRLPKRGFTNIFKKRVETVNLGSLNVFSEGEEVTPEILESRGLVKAGAPVKVLAKGELHHKLTLTVQAASKAAMEKVAAVGGTLKIVPFVKKAKD
jgi:large subunit ribosomal protein L15